VKYALPISDRGKEGKLQDCQEQHWFVLPPICSNSYLIQRSTLCRPRALTGSNSGCRAVVSHVDLMMCYDRRLLR
jgi:hypothetical protein